MPSLAYQKVVIQGKILKANVIQQRILSLDCYYQLVHFRYGGSPVLKRQVVRMGGGRPELELHPLSLKLLRHQTTSRPSTAGFSNAVHTAVQVIFFSFLLTDSQNFFFLWVL